MDYSAKLKYVLFLIVMILFWTAFNQLYYSFPVFVDQWIDTSQLYQGIHTCSLLAGRVLSAHLTEQLRQ